MSDGLAVGDVVELDVEKFATGGHCIARHEGRAVFVRHALPGERVRARVLDVRASLARAEAIELLGDPSPDRVEAPCRYAGPGGCGGCDFQHVALPAQRRAKAVLVREQLTRLARLDPEHPLGPSTLEGLEVEEVPGAPGLGWRTRLQLTVDDRGRAGLRRHRSHDVVPIDHCLLAHPDVDALDLTAISWHGFERVEGIASSAGDRLVVLTPRPRADAQAASRAGRPAKQPARAPQLPRELRTRLGAEVGVRVAGQSAGIGRGWVSEQVQQPGDAPPVTARVSGSGFWQVHPGAPAALVSAVCEQLQAEPGDQVLDLYSGVGLFGLSIASIVGPRGSVTLVESDPRAVSDARRNAHLHPNLRIEQGRVETVLGRLRAAGLVRPRVVVLDPPRSGAGREVVRELAELNPERICYVACDPAALARDTAFLADEGYRLDRLRAFDLFPQTHHVECVARFTREL